MRPRPDPRDQNPHKDQICGLETLTSVGLSGDFAGVRRQTEPDEYEDREHDARQDDVHDVELVAALEVEREDDVRVAALVFHVQVRDGPPAPLRDG